LSFTTEEIFQLISKGKKSIHLENFLSIPKKFSNIKLNEKWSQLIKIRDICNFSIEEKRSKKEIGSSLEAELEIKLGKEFIKISENIDFAELCITSKSIVEFTDGNEISVKTKKAVGEKCPVCWKISPEPCSRHA